jgi:cysteine sulfinate desulfinase/cysteine desulfurase-like protein
VGCAIALEAITPAALETLQDTTTHWLNLWNIYLHNVGPHAGCVNTPLNKDYHVGGVINLSLPPLSGDQWVNQLGLRGIYIASGSACHEAQLSPSHVLLASGRSPQLSSSALRFSFNHHTDASQLTHVFEVVTQLHQRHLKRKHS